MVDALWSKKSCERSRYVTIAAYGTDGDITWFALTGWSIVLIYCPRALPSVRVVEAFGLTMPIVPAEVSIFFVAMS